MVPALKAGSTVGQVWRQKVKLFVVMAVAIGIIRVLGWVHGPGGSGPRRCQKFFNSKMKTDVWALVGIVADYSDTTSDHDIHDFETCLSRDLGVEAGLSA